MATSPEVAKRIRVLMIGPFPTDRNRLDGGVAAAMTYLAEELASDASIELIGVRVAASRSSVSEASSFGWPVVDLPLGKLSLSTLYRRQKRALRAAIEQYQPDIVHGQGTDIAGHLAIACGRPSVVTVHGLLAECARYQTDLKMRIRASLTARLTEKNTIRRASNLIAISPYVTRYYEGEIRGIVHNIPNAVAQTFFNVSRAAESGRLLFAGRISHGKGLPELFRAISRNRSSVSRLVLAGANHDSSYVSQLNQMIANLGLGEIVSFTGLLDEKALIHEFGRAAALVLPSHQETAPMVVQQAMAAGLPVIATDVGGIPDQIEHETTGLMFRPGDDAGLAELLARLANEPALGPRLSRAAKRLAEVRYAAASVTRATIAVYRSMMAGQSGEIARGTQ